MDSDRGKKTRSECVERGVSRERNQVRDKNAENSISEDGRKNSVSSLFIYSVFFDIFQMAK